MIRPGSGTCHVVTTLSSNPDWDDEQTYPTPGSSLPLIRARYGAQARGLKPNRARTPKPRQAHLADSRPGHVVHPTARPVEFRRGGGSWLPIQQTTLTGADAGTVGSRREYPSVATNRCTRTVSSPIGTRVSPKSICNWRPGNVSNRTVARASAANDCRNAACSIVRSETVTPRSCAGPHRQCCDGA